MAIRVSYCLISEFEHKIGVEFYEELLPEHVVLVADRCIDQKWGILFFLCLINLKHEVLSFENPESALGLPCLLLDAGEQQIVLGMHSELLILESIQSQQGHALEIVPAAAAHPVLVFCG